MMSPFASVTAKSARVSRFAMALALAFGTVAGSLAVSAPAQAQENSRGFANAYSPVAALVGGEAPNWAAARDQFETLVAAIENEDDRNIAGNFALQIGNNLNDRAFQRRGLEMMLQSGKVAPTQVGLFRYYLGNFALEMDDLASAESNLQAALDAGYVPEGDIGGHPMSQLLQVLLLQDRAGEVATRVQGLLDAAAAGGAPVPGTWVRFGLQGALDADNTEAGVAMAVALAASSTDSDSWNVAGRSIMQLVELDEQAQLDLLRVMRLRSALDERSQYSAYINAADERIMGNEVLPVLEEAVAAGLFSPGDEYVNYVRTQATERGAQDRLNLAANIAEARGGDAFLAMEAADILWSIEDFAQAEEFYTLALERGADRDTALTRIGMAQARQGKAADAAATLAQVGGARAPVAQLWAAYAAQ